MKTIQIPLEVVVLHN